MFIDMLRDLVNPQCNNFSGSQMYGRNSDSLLLAAPLSGLPALWGGSTLVWIACL